VKAYLRFAAGTRNPFFRQTAIFFENLGFRTFLGAYKVKIADKLSAAQHFFASDCGKIGVFHLSAPLLGRLTPYPWPESLEILSALRLTRPTNP
jgi:hypothetical protein